MFPFYDNEHSGVPEPPHVQLENIGQIGMMIAYYITYLCLHDTIWRIDSSYKDLILPKLQTHISSTALEAAEGCLRLILWLTSDAQGAKGIMAAKFCDGPLSMAKVTYDRLGNCWGIRNTNPSCSGQQQRNCLLVNSILWHSGRALFRGHMNFMI